jgi:ribonuclease D
LTLRETRDYEVVTAAESLTSVVEAARAAKLVGIDTEFIREKTYSARLCLLQIATSQVVWLVDPIETAVDAIAELLSDESVETIVHSGRQDLDLLHEMTGLVPTRVFDVQVAAGFVGLGASLPYGRLVEEILGVTLTKGEAYTDWCRRPLRRSQLSYAADDVRYLPAVAFSLKKQLADLDRTEWVWEEMATFEDPQSYTNDSRDAWRRVSGRGSLSGRGLAVLREVAEWREKTARSSDLPRGWVVKDHVLVEIARRSPQSMDALQRVRGLGEKQAARWGRPILEAVERGRKAEAVSIRPPPPRPVLARARMLAGLADAVVRARCEQARIAPEVATTRTELESLLIDSFDGSPDPDRHRTLRGWRKDLVGDAVVALASGKMAVRVIQDPPFVEEVEVT